MYVNLVWKFIANINIPFVIYISGTPCWKTFAKYESLKDQKDSITTVYSKPQKIINVASGVYVTVTSTFHNKWNHKVQYCIDLGDNP